MDEQKNHFHKKKSLGQHFLTSDIVPAWMCDAAALTKGDLVVEIGPGTGILTQELLKRGATVLALEVDERAITVLKETFEDEIASGNLILLHADMRTFDITTLPLIDTRPYKVVANIPYYLSGMLFRLFLESSIQPTDLIYLVQKEVAKRITTDLDRNEKESLFSLSVKVYGNPKYIKTVSRGHFAPQPRVDSGIIAITDISKEKFKDIDEALFFTILHLGFGQKRKQLLGNLAKEYDRDVLIHIFSTLEIPLTVRAEDIPVAKWLTLVQKISLHS